jgi:hypothetical protein
MRYTTRLLDSLRQEGDPVPDAIVARLAASGETSAVNAIMRGLVTNDQPVPAALPDDLETWLREGARLPVDVDPARLARAGELFQEHGLQLTAILSTAALVNCYADARGVRALTFTETLARSPYRRAAETAQFVLYVMAPNGLAPGGTGIRVIQKVRLMHAALRHLIRATGRWPESELGTPICQEDMLLTLLMFSSETLKHLSRLGVRLDRSDAEDYLYTWTVIGRLLGIRADIMPADLREAENARRLIVARAFGPTPEGVMLTRALLEMHDRLVPGEMFDGLLPALVRFLVGETVADWMEVPRTRWDRAMRHYIHLGRYLDFLDRSTGSLGDLVDSMALALLDRAAISATGYTRAAYDIPTELRLAWVARRAAGPLMAAAPSARAYDPALDQRPAEGIDTKGPTALTGREPGSITSAT